MLLKSILLSIVFMIPIAIAVYFFNKKIKTIEKDSLVLEKLFEVESELLKLLKEDSQEFLEWNFFAFIEGYYVKQVSIKEYVQKYIEYFGTVNEFHTFRSEEQ